MEKQQSNPQLTMIIWILAGLALMVIGKMISGR
jgi:hypothetical protein